MNFIRLLLASAAIALLAPAAALAEPRSERDAREALEAAEALLGPSAVTAGASGREATLVLRDLALAEPMLKGAERRRAVEILSRPSDPNDFDYFGKEAAASPACDSHFCVHWAVGRNAPGAADGDGDGVPDWIEMVLAAADRSYQVENTSLGWRDAKSDRKRGARGGKGGKGHVDIYVTDLGRNLFGFAAPDPGQKGSSRSAYLVVDNDYAGFAGVPADLLAVTMAHEYNHVLQFAYDTFQDIWLFEATATWVEDLVYPAINDYLAFLPDFARRPHRPMAEPNRRQRKMYGSAAWNHWLTGRLGAATVRNAWARSTAIRPPHFAVGAYERAIDSAKGGSFSRQFAAFAAATAEWNSSSAFPDAALYPDMSRSGGIGAGRQRTRLDHTAYRLYDVGSRAGAALRLTAKAPRRTRAAVALVGRIGPRDAGTVVIESEYLSRGGRGSVRIDDPARFDRITAVLINADGRVRGSSRRYTADDARFTAKVKPVS